MTVPAVPRWPSRSADDGPSTPGSRRAGTGCRTCRRASGARYTDGRVSVWNKGTEVLLERDGQSWQCRENQPREPR